MGYLDVISAFTVLSLTMALDSCPPPAQIDPCTCDREGVNCMKATSVEEIRKAFKANFKFKGVQSVWIQDTPITYVPSDLFNGVKALSFFVEMNAVSSVDMKAFDHSKDHLRLLSFFGNKMGNFDYSSLRAFPELVTFNIGRNLITSIPANAFTHDNIATIILAQNRISSIGANAFKGLPKLKRLSLSAMSLTTLGAHAVALSPEALGVEMHLDFNGIYHISSTAFDEASPKLLNLNGNKLTSLTKEAFGSLFARLSQSGGVVALSGNPFTCRGCDYRWLLDNKQNYYRFIFGFVCPDGTGILDLNSIKIGC